MDLDLKQALVLDKVLGKARNRIYRVGIELEGGWTNLPDGTRVIHDGSVHIAQATDLIGDVQRRHADGNLSREEARQRIAVITAQAANMQTGELPSVPLQVEEFPVWMRKFYPQLVNDTCGLHVHMSFTSALHYQLCMDPRYPATILRYVDAWARQEKLAKDHPIWPRLAGKSRYCQFKFFADQQAKVRTKEFNRERPGHRYTMINYAYSQHGTLECRLLPMFEGADLGIRAISNILAITNAYLLVAAKKESKLQQTLEYSPSDRIVEHRELRA